MMMMMMINLTHLMMMTSKMMMMSPQMMTQMKSPLIAQMIHYNLHHTQQTYSNRSSGPNHVQYCFSIDTYNAQNNVCHV